MYSIVTYTGNGVTTNYSITFPYIQQSDVEVYVNGVLKSNPTDYGYVTASSILFTVAPSNGAEIKIKRNTNKSTALVNFTDGSILSADNLDLSAQQLLYVAQELYDSTATNVEGTWTPTITRKSGDGTLTITNGKYVKVGSMIILTFNYSHTDPSSASDSYYNVTIPYVVSSSIFNPLDFSNFYMNGNVSNQTGSTIYLTSS